MKIKQQDGFSLIEMIVATVLFLVAVMASMGIFLSTISANNKVNAMQKVENEVRYIIETISKEIRLDTIDYNHYASNTENPRHTLALRDSADNTLLFTLDGNGIVQMSLDDGNSWSDLNTDNISVDELNFYLLPNSDPFSQSSENIKQPMVILYLVAHYNNGDESNGQIEIQTTISSRQYKR